MASTDEYLAQKVRDQRNHFYHCLASMAASFALLRDEYDPCLSLGEQSEQFQRSMQNEGEATLDLLVLINRLNVLEEVPRVG